MMTRDNILFWAIVAPAAVGADLIARQYVGDYLSLLISLPTAFLIGWLVQRFRRGLTKASSLSRSASPAATLGRVV
jgi:membrane protein implicated in regulation of membrane protease activity